MIPTATTDMEETIMTVPISATTTLETGPRVRKERRALKEHRVIRDLPGRKDLQGRKAHKAHLVRRDQLELES